MSATNSTIAETVLTAAAELRDAANRLHFARPITHVYNPLEYAWDAHVAYVRAYANSPKCVVFLGMNPGPFGMVQTGVPFGEIEAVRDWLGIAAPVGQPSHVHSKRPVTGFDCRRSEVSGKRLWRLFARRFGGARNFFASHFVMNYCPLAFLEESGCNRTPDKLSTSEKRSLFVVCDKHLRDVVSALQPEWLIGIGRFAAKQAEAVFEGHHPRICRISHPSPANPAANRDWAGMATRQLQRLGVWQER